MNIFVQDLGTFGKNMHYNIYSNLFLVSTHSTRYLMILNSPMCSIGSLESQKISKTRSYSIIMILFTFVSRKSKEWLESFVQGILSQGKWWCYYYNDSRSLSPLKHTLRSFKVKLGLLSIGLNIFKMMYILRL